jgi:hypothetical protein
VTYAAHVNSAAALVPFPRLAVAKHADQMKEQAKKDANGAVTE